MACGGGRDKRCSCHSKATTTLSRSRDQEKPITFITAKVCVTHKATENGSSSTPDGNPWNKLDDGMVETVLARIPTSDIFRCLFVCKRWDSIIHSPTFSVTSNQLFDRRPWFLIFNVDIASVVYDMEVSEWRRVQLPLPCEIIGKLSCPVVASGGLMCFISGIDSFIVCNPLTSLVRLLPELCLTIKYDHVTGIFYGKNDYVKGVAMHLSSRSNYKVFVAIGKWPYLCLKVFSSEEKAWTGLLVRELITDGDVPWPVERCNTNVDWAPVRKKGAAILGNKGQVVLVYYLTLDGELLYFDTQKGTIFLCPRLDFPKGAIMSNDLVECGGRVFVVVLVKVFRSVALSVWEFDHENAEWKHITTMPPNIMSQDYHRCPTKINCAGNGDYIMVCACFYSSISTCFNHMVMYNMRKNTWVELPPYSYSEPRLCTIWPFAFKPDIEAKV